jgi:tol-pal system protein YbgF
VTWTDRLCCLIIGMALTAVAACDSAMLFNQRRPSTSPSAAPAPAGDATQQIRALEDKVQLLERRLAALEQRQAPPKATPAAPPPKPPKPAAKASPAPSSPAADKIYQEGLRLYQAKKYAAAREKFSKYLTGNPQGPKAPEARYYLGDSFYQEKRFTEARVEFNKMAQQHPKSILAPTALLRQAYAYQQTNQKTNYLVVLKKLIQQYPQSPEAREARNLLKQQENPR